MRIVAWNCCRGPFEKKLAALEQLAPDVAVISEALAPAKETNQLLWFPSNASRLGIQVRSFNGFRIRRLKRAPELPNCVVPLRVTGGAADFNLLAVWTWPAPSYTRAFLNGLAAYQRLLERGPAVVAGDFNGNPVFDKHKARAKWWTQGFERPFHIDFCFVPQRWAETRLQVEVPTGPSWRALSDHFPLVVEAGGP